MSDLDQLVFAPDERKGMSLYSASFPVRDNDSWQDWDGKLMLYARLLSEPGGKPPPRASFTHVAFADGTAALVRRSGQPGDVGRNVAHAVIGDRAAINDLLPRLVGWDRWLDHRPVSLQLPKPDPADFPGPRPFELDDPVLVPIATAVLARPDSSFSVIGVPEELRLPVVWRLRSLWPEQEWTFSTYEKSDEDKPNLPRVVFLAERPTALVEPQEGRVRIDVNDDVRSGDHTTKQARAMLNGQQVPATTTAVAAVPDEPVTEVVEVVEMTDRHEAPAPARPLQPAGPTAPVRPLQPAGPTAPAEVTGLPRTGPRRPAVAVVDGDALAGILHSDDPLHRRLERLTRLLDALDASAVDHQVLAWVEDVAVPRTLVAFIVDYLESRGVTGFDRALARRWRAEQGIHHLPPEPVGPPPARPPVDARLVERAWSEQEAWSRKAGQHKRYVVALRLIVLGCLLSGAVGAVGAAQLTTGPRWAAALVAGATAAVVAIGTWMRKQLEPEERKQWTYARRRSESLKSEVCRYLAGADPYRRADADQRLRRHVDELLPIATAATAAKSPGITGITTYTRLRVQDQIAHHVSKADRYETSLKRARLAEFGFGVAATVLAAVGAVVGGHVVVWIGVFTTIAGAITAHITLTGYEHLVVRYRRTAADLHRLLTALADQPDEAAQDLFVAECERVLAQQNDDWVAQLTPSAAGKDQR
ncbi:DUF4231 domain-containing protein [Lentzea chajnantorensis]